MSSEININFCSLRNLIPNDLVWQKRFLQTPSLVLSWYSHVSNGWYVVPALLKFPIFKDTSCKALKILLSISFSTVPLDCCEILKRF